MTDTNDILPGDTVIVLRHFKRVELLRRKLVIAYDTAASFISRTETHATVILSGGCRATFPISEIRRLDEYVPGLPFGLVNPTHEDDVQTREHADYAIACAQADGFKLRRDCSCGGWFYEDGHSGKHRVGCTAKETV